MPDQAPARLLDLTRLVSRANRRPTGIDRVELAYLRVLVAEGVPLYGLVRTAWGFVLLDRQGCQALLARVTGKLPWGRADLLSRIRPRLSYPRKCAEADTRRLALARCLPSGLGRLISRHLPRGTVYVNVGHTNLTERVLTTLKQQLNARVVVMIHDTIPLDFPQFQRPGTVEKFQAMLKRVGRNASLILCNSAMTRDDVVRHLMPYGDVPETLVAWLGVDEITERAEPIMPVGFDRDRPFFVTVGTIEPRKNHIFLLDLWAEMARVRAPERMPQLLICGARGWNNEVVFARLGSDPMMGRDVFEMSNLSDPEIASLLERAKGALFPSHAEGYGLPPVEALSLGVPVICNNLEIYTEILGDYPVYANVDDRYLWLQEIEGLADGQKGRQVTGKAFQSSDWEAHFNAVLSRL